MAQRGSVLVPFLITLALLLVGGSAYYLGSQRSNVQSNSIQVNSDKNNKKLEIDVDYQYLKFGGKVFDLTKDRHEPYVETAVDSSSITGKQWRTIANVSTLGVNASIFNYQLIPNTKNILFTLTTNVGLITEAEYAQTAYIAYLFDSQREKVDLIYQSVAGYSAANYMIPVFSGSSKDGQYIALDLLGCWGCGGHKPETILIDLKHADNNRKFLGKVDSVTWSENGVYTYTQGSKKFSGSLKYPVD